MKLLVLLYISCILFVKIYSCACGKWDDEGSCEDCAKGYYCDGTNKIICLLGNYCNRANVCTPNPCSIGSYCPIGTNKKNPDCGVGYYCPDPTSKIKCDEYMICLGTRLISPEKDYNMIFVYGGGAIILIAYMVMCLICTCLGCIMYILYKKRKNLKISPIAKKLLNRKKLNGKELTFAFTDIQNSTRLWHTCKKGMEQALIIHNNIIRESLEKFGGTEIKTIGDAFFVMFESPLQAILWAADIQIALLRARWPRKLLQQPDAKKEGSYFKGLRVRIGIHVGDDYTIIDSDYFGNTINETARFEQNTHGGQICISEEVKIQIERKINVEYKRTFSLENLGKFKFKGIDEHQTIYELKILKLKRKFNTTIPEKDEATLKLIRDLVNNKFPNNPNK